MYLKFYTVETVSHEETNKDHSGVSTVWAKLLEGSGVVVKHFQYTTYSRGIRISPCLVVLEKVGVLTLNTELKGTIVC